MCRQTFACCIPCLRESGLHPRTLCNSTRVTCYAHCPCILHSFFVIRNPVLCWRCLWPASDVRANDLACCISSPRESCLHPFLCCGLICCFVSFVFVLFCCKPIFGFVMCVFVIFTAVWRLPKFTNPEFCDVRVCDL